LLVGGAIACAETLLIVDNSNVSVSKNRLLQKIIYQDMLAPMPKVVNDLCALLGITLIIAALAMHYTPLEFPGRYAILPVLGTALIIVAGKQAGFNSRCLANRWLVYIGLISFPLYLWHWPLLTFARIIENGELSNQSRNVAVVLAFMLAIVTYHFLEKPIRFSRKGRGLKAIILTVMLTGCGALGYFIRAHDGLVYRYTQTQQPEIMHTDAVLPVLTTSKVVLMGDSNAGHFQDGLVPLYRGKIVVIASVGWPYLDGTIYKQGYVPHKTHVGTPKVTEDALLRIISDPTIDVVIISNNDQMYFRGDILRSYPEPVPFETTAMAYEAGLKRTVKRLTNAGKFVIVVKSIPYLSNFTSVMACTAAILPIPRKHPESCVTSRTEVRKYRDKYDLAVSRALDGLTNVAVFDTLAYLCDKQNCYVHKDGVVMYENASHIN
jgi:SGNH domain (fused to AT3 domains)